MALIQCSDCNKEMSDRAPTCPSCGGPNPTLAPSPPPLPAADELVIDERTVHEQLAKMQGGTTCPFCGHHVPAGATVCRCGAYYGWKDRRDPTKLYRLGKKLLLISAMIGGGSIGLLFLISPFMQHASSDNPIGVILFLGVFVGIVLGLFGGLAYAANSESAKKGQLWWRSF